MKDSDKALITGTIGVVALIIILIFGFSASHHKNKNDQVAKFAPVQHFPRTETPKSQTAVLGSSEVPRRAGDPSLYPGLGTPGRADPNISQAVIAETICRTGFAKAVRPSGALLSRLKLQRMQEANAPGTPGDYEFDHIIPIELGGCTYCNENLWLEPLADARQKDLVENYLHHEVCVGRLPLSAAQKAIADDWYSVYLTIMGQGRPPP